MAAAAAALRYNAAIVIANENDNTRDRQLPAERWLAGSNGRLSAAAGIRRRRTILIAAMAKMAGGMRAQLPCKDIDTINGPLKRAKIRGIMTSFDNYDCELRRLHFIIINAESYYCFKCAMCNVNITTNYAAKSNWTHFIVLNVIINYNCILRDLLCSVLHIDYRRQELMPNG